MKTIKILLLLLLPLFSFAQQKAITKFNIERATINGKDYSEKLVEQKAYIIFYKVEEDVYMACYWMKDKTQSFGPVYNFSSKTDNRANCSWNYRNSYDLKSGEASVNITKGKYGFKVVIEAGPDIIIYSGKI